MNITLDGVQALIKVSSFFEIENKSERFAIAVQACTINTGKPGRLIWNYKVYIMADMKTCKYIDLLAFECLHFKLKCPLSRDYGSEERYENESKTDD